MSALGAIYQRFWRRRPVLSKEHAELLANIKFPCC